jgi:hypothetical protein
VAGGEKQAVYRAGIRFDDAGERDDVLSGLLEETAVVNLDQRLTGRFRMRREAAVNVTFVREFHVSSLSRTELVLDADLLLDVDSEYELELRGGDDRPPIVGTVLVDSLRSLPEREGGPSFRIHTRLVKLEPEARAALQNLIRREMRAGLFVGNEATGVFHLLDCQYAVAAGRRFGSRRAALAAGLRPGGCCDP